MYWCELDHKESWAPKSWCFWTVVLKKTLESPLDCKRSNQPILKESVLSNWNNWCWSWSSNTFVTSCKEPTHWKRPWCWERLKAGEGDDRGWDGWMASLTQWTWVWAFSGSLWWTEKPQFSSVAQSCPTLCDPMNCSTPGLTAHHLGNSVLGVLWKYWCWSWNYSTLATEKPSVLQYMVSQTVRHRWLNWLCVLVCGLS